MGGKRRVPRVLIHFVRRAWKLFFRLKRGFGLWSRDGLSGLTKNCCIWENEADLVRLISYRHRHRLSCSRIILATFYAAIKQSKAATTPTTKKFAASTTLVITCRETVSCALLASQHFPPLGRKTLVLSWNENRES
ncbi:unnamed protein product [Clavelina lepadiformis]|uniref:Uncharacterized protein n=1 Tax=Clavelina lepadiformis TaxID=159417 RepID=A0ABP0GA55_CLALP